MQRNRKLNRHFYKSAVYFTRYSLKTFFAKSGKTNTFQKLFQATVSCSFEKVFEIYTTRRTIEVFSKNTSYPCDGVEKINVCYFVASIMALK